MMPLNPPMQYSKTGLALTENFEGKRNTAYWDAIGNAWTIGYGATGPGIVQGMQWTDAQCEADLLQRLGGVANRINAWVNVPLTQGEFDALCDFGYNGGLGALQHSTLLKLLNAGDFAGAAAQFDDWDHASGKVVAGLLRRRQAETAEFNTPDPASC